MNLVFITNFANHHQIPLADEFYRLLGEDFRMIVTDPLPDWLAKGGYDSSLSRSYLVRIYEEGVNIEAVMKMIDEADAVIAGAAPEDFLIRRINEGKLTFRYSERWFKAKPWYLTGVEGWRNYYNYHFRHRNKPLYMLAASAFMANDTYKIGCYRNKVYKWGYFTKVEDFDVDSMLKSTSGYASILWCARFLELKHPELPITLAKRLKDEGYDFHLDMIGTGEKFEAAVALARTLGVDDVVSFLGNMPNEDVLRQMRGHRIFLFTSDRNEGWGAVLNEAMSNGCAVVASHLIGAAPFLIDDGNNGLLFKSGDLESLHSKVKLLLDNASIVEKLARNAVITMQNTWSPKEAAERFITLANNLMDGKDTPFEKGPISKAYPI